MECQGLTSTDSKVYPEQTNLACCGKENCNLVACDGYISVQAPTGLQTCCGYEDCHNKECNNLTHTVSVSGKVYACCGSRDCYVKSCDNYTTGLLTEVCCGYEQCIEDQCLYKELIGTTSQTSFELRLFLHPEDMNKKIYLSFGAEECATFLVNGQKATEYHYNYPGCGNGYNRPDFVLYDLSKPSVRKYFKEGVNWIRGSIFDPSDPNMEFKACANFETFIKMKMNTWKTDTGSIKEFNGSEYENI